MSIDFSTDLGGNDDLGGDGLDLNDILNREEEQQNSGTGSAGGASGSGADKEGDAALKKANELLAQQLADSQKRINDLETNRQRFNTNIDQPPTPAPPPVDLTKLKGELSELMVNDPGEFAIRLYNAARNSAIEEMKGQLGPLAQGNASLDVTAFRGEKSSSDPQYKNVEAEFNSLVADPNVIAQMANQTPQQRRVALEFLYDAAAGRAARKAPPVDTSKRDRQPPPYSGGQGFALGTESATKYNGKSLNATQKEILRVAKESGINDPKRIKAMLDDAASEG